MLCWGVFAAVFLFRKLSAGGSVTKRDRVSLIGIVIQVVGMAFVWWARRSIAEPIVPAPISAQLVVAVVAILLAIASIWMVLTAVRTLGEQWSLSARLIDGHRLITSGPYRLVRHPIYTGIFGLALATGLVLTRWIPFGVGIFFLALGTVIRVRVEERLLREQFGNEFETYARRVPAVIPGVGVFSAK